MTEHDTSSQQSASGAPDVDPGAVTDGGGMPDGAGAKGLPPFLSWLPKTFTWVLVLLSIYFLRHFFFVIFMTFIVTYIMRGIIVRVTWLATRRRQAPYLERILAVVCFVLMIFSVYQTGLLLWPPIQTQYHQLVGRVSQFEADREFENIGTKTVGWYLFDQKYGDREDEAYEEAFQAFLAEANLIRPTAFESFERLQSQMVGALNEESLKRRWVEERVSQRSKDEAVFKAWYIAGPGKKYFAEEKDALVGTWEADARKFLGAEGFEQRKNSANYEISRDADILEEIFVTMSSDASASTEQRNNWREELRKEELAKAEVSADFAAHRLSRHEKLYNEQRGKQPDEFPYEFEKYLVLKKAFDEAVTNQDQSIFARALDDPPEDQPDEDRELEQHQDFMLAKQKEEWEVWWREDPLSVRKTVDEYKDKVVSEAGTWITKLISYAFNLPVQLSLSLLLSFFITFDIPKLRKGVRKLKTSRVGGIYEEIAPGLISFGHLIGRAFQAQGVIALFNTLLTFLAIHFLDIDNEVFLCAIVFVCSFIPVLGVVLSSAPIAIMAILQPGGTITLAIQIIVAIILIHFIETSVLNPKILGDMLHLHPVFVLAVLALGEHFFGVWGLLLGVPVTVYVVRFVILREGIPGFIEYSANESGSTDPPPDDPPASPEGSSPEAAEPAEAPPISAEVRSAVQ
ncbi:MAG: AI-2E family transporter [Planctomycetota bacterium]